MAPALRLINGDNSPLDPLQGGKAGNKNPSLTPSGNDAETVLWDIQQFAYDQYYLESDPPPQISEVHHNAAPAGVIAQTKATRITMVPQTVRAVSTGTQYLIVRRNPERAGLIICNPTQDSVLISFGRFIIDGTTSFGMIVPQGLNLEFLEGSIPIDDIYIINNTTANRLMLAYEGAATVEGNI